MKIFVVCHKDVVCPSKRGYAPVSVGKLSESNREDLLYRDNSGDNISLKNCNYSELTALYWIWKNCNEDIVGLVHYRRFFANYSLWKTVLSEKRIRKILNGKDIIIPKARVMDVTGQLPEQTIWEHFEKWHNINDLIQTREIIREKYPEYINSFEEVCSKKNIWPYNMMICKKELFDEYCQWLFDILFELEKRIDISSYDWYQKRVFGFISERLLNVWITHNQLKYEEKVILNTSLKRNMPFSILSKIRKS